MAFFGVTVETVDTVRNHPNADRLDIATLQGMSFQFVCGRGQYRPGDQVVYFPVDSVIPVDVLRKMNLEGKLSGPNKNRVKTLRLRGEISQGLVGSLSLLDGMTDGDITSYLRVTKYEQPAVPCRAGRLIGLPTGLIPYDIEGADRFSLVLESLMDVPVLVMEKVEGSNFSVTWSHREQRMYVNQRCFSIQPVDGSIHDWWKAAQERGIIAFVEFLRQTPGWSQSDITVYGEIIGPGIQGNIYHLLDHQVRIFDIKIDGRFLDADKMLSTTRRFYESVGLGTDDLSDAGGHLAPVLSEGKTLRSWLDGKSLREASHGQSMIYPTLREGVVVRPMIESHTDTIGRVILKQRDPIYLLKNES